MGKLLLVLGIIWASPITLLGFLFYIGPLWFLKRYRYVGWNGTAWRWDFEPKKHFYQGKLDKFLDRQWRKWSGSTVGNLVVAKTVRGRVRQVTVDHENVHVRQAMVLGPFMPVLYGASWLFIRCFLRNADPYYDNPFEIDARRGADQIVDIPGTIKRIRESAAKGAPPI